MREITHIDCFAGPGGITTGFRAAGIKTLLAIEKVDSCVETFQVNHSSVPIIHKDIRDVKDDELRYLIDTDIDILTAGMPCETFSTAGDKSRSFYDDRQVLYREAIRVADTINCKMILFENVPGITTKRTARDSDKLIIDEIFETLARFGYKYHLDTLLNAVNFGVPQRRERYFILASREELELRFPVSVENHFVSVKEALADLPYVEANDKKTSWEYTGESSKYAQLMRDNNFWQLDKYENGLTYHAAPKHRVGTIKRFALIEQGEGLKDLFFKFNESKIIELQNERVLPKRWYIQRNRRLHENQPSVTVTSHCLDELVHPTLNRALTVREVARLQSFPDFYDFKGGPILCPHIYETQDKYEQIGDAVPPLLAYKLGITIRDILGVNDGL